MKRKTSVYCHMTAVVLITGIPLLLLLSDGDGWRKTRELSESHAQADCDLYSQDDKEIDRIFDDIILEPRIILFWTTFYGGHDFGFGLGQQPFQDHKCEVQNCLTTTNQSAVTEANAVVYHMVDLLAKPKVPVLRRPDQQYVFFFMEPPQKADASLMAALPKYSDFFNLTMTYRIDSSVYNPFSMLVRRAAPAPNVVQRCRGALGLKTKMVAWFSECDEDAMAKAYVEELSKHIQVDTFGPCGKMKGECDGSAQSAACWDKVDKEYWFLLAIESKICKDFVTDRTYRGLQYNVLPVVYGGGNYSVSTPPNSVINVFDFPTASSLAAYLHKLSKDNGAYMWHMEWKGHWDHRGWGYGFCHLCKILNEKKKQNQVVHDLSKFWSRDQCGKDFLSHFRRHRSRK